MKNNINIDDLYVVCRICKATILIEPWVQYETFGKELHQFYIWPKMLLAQKTDEHYKLVKTNKEINIINPKSSVYTKSSCGGTLYGYLLIDAIRGNGLVMKSQYPDSAFEKYNEDMNLYGYLMPFKEYVKNVTNIDLKKLNITEAKVLLALINNYRKHFILSTNEEEAKEQINKKVKRIK